MESKKGSLTIEASIALTAFIFLVVTILSFATVYRAQGIISHATLQTSQSLAIESYYRETISKVDTAQSASMLIKFANILGMDISGADDWYQSLGDEGTDFYRILKETFVYAIASDEESADKVLEAAGVVDGMDGIDFSYSAISGGDIIVNARYEVKLPFSFFGEQTISLSKSAKTKAFSKVKGDTGYVEPDDDDPPGSSGGGFRENDGPGDSSGGGFR